MELDYKEIGRNIRQNRMKKGLKQKELAEKISMTEQHISHIENAHTQLSLPTLIAIANVLEVDCNTLLGKTQEGAEKAILHEELEDHLREIGSDARKLRLYVEICRLVKEFSP